MIRRHSVVFSLGEFPFLYSALAFLPNSLDLGAKNRKSGQKISASAHYRKFSQSET